MNSHHGWRAFALGLLLLVSLFAACGGSIGSAVAAPAAELTGRWRAIDGDTGKPYAVIEFVAQGDSVSGFVRELIADGASPTPERCSSRCPPGKAGMPVIGMEVIWGLKRDGARLRFVDGHALLPDDGSLYRCHISVQANGRELDLRYFVGLPALGASERWVRIDD